MFLSLLPLMNSDHSAALAGCGGFCGYLWCFPVEVPVGSDWRLLILWPLNTDCD